MSLRCRCEVVDSIHVALQTVQKLRIACNICDVPIGLLTFHTALGHGPTGRLCTYTPRCQFLERVRNIFN